MKMRFFFRSGGAAVLAVSACLSACLSACRKAQTPASEHVVTVTARDFTFECVDQIPSGWTTFRFNNEGSMTHFFLLTLLPEGATFQDYIEGVGGAFGAAWEALRTGKADKAGAGQILGEKLPAWYANAKFMGGPGLVSGKHSTETTIKLVPGNYVMECYIKTEDGRFHSELGMIRPLTVTSEVSPGTPPEADITIGVSNTSLDVSGNVTAGEHTAAVNFREHPPYGLGNDVHLVRLTDLTDLDKVAEWMDWMNLTGLAPPDPAKFLGGAQEMPVGHTAYFKVHLTPGRYAWVSESSPPKGLVREFVVE